MPRPAASLSACCAARLRVGLLVAPVWMLAVLLLAPGAQGQFVAGFELDAVTFRAERSAQPRLELHVRVPYPSLRFVRRGDTFAGAYTLTASIHRAGRNDRAGDLIARRSWDRRVTAADFEATRSDSLADYSSHGIELPEGRYVVRLRLDDRASAHVATREQVVEVPNLNQPLAMSDLLLARPDAPEARRAAARVSATLPSDERRLAVYFEVYARQPERLRVHYAIAQLGAERRAGWLASITFGMLGRRERETNTVLQLSEWLTASQGRTPTLRRFDTRRLEIGEYELVVRLERADGTPVAERTRPFSIRWLGLFEQLQDLDVAIAQLKYIAKEREIREMREAPTFEERLRLFQAFWDRRDPSPGSPRNERMEEYYYRVAHAARRYGRLDGTGWQTDQGEVFIRFGDPDRVERRPGPRPSEIWYYNRIGRRFIFVDDSGSGDFRLLVPIWDERTRM